MRYPVCVDHFDGSSNFEIFIYFVLFISDNLKNTKSTIPGPWSLPILGASWLYTSIGPYSHVEYHTSNFDKFKKYGPVVREEVLWNYPLIHLFDATDIDTVLKYKSDTPYRPHNEADVFYR